MTVLAEAVLHLTEQLQAKIGAIMGAYSQVEDGSLSPHDYFSEYFDRSSSTIYEFRNLYANFYEKAGVTCRAELDSKRRELNGTNNGVLSAIEKLRSIERSWEQFLDKIDQQLNFMFANIRQPTFVDFDKIDLTDCGNGKRLSLKSCLSNKVSGKYALLVLMRFYGCPYSSVHIQELSEHAQKFDQKLCNIIIVCKGSLEGGQSWVKKSGVQFPLLADDRSSFIQNFSFRRSAKSLLGPEGIDATVRAKSKYGLVSLEPDPLTDLYQLGGDIIVNKQGEVLFFFHSGAVDDRPSVELLLSKVPDK